MWSTTISHARRVNAVWLFLRIYQIQVTWPWKFFYEIWRDSRQGLQWISRDLFKVTSCSCIHSQTPRATAKNLKQDVRYFPALPLHQLSSSSVICCRLAITCEADSCQQTVYTLVPLCSWKFLWTVNGTLPPPISAGCYDPPLSLLCELQRTGWSLFEHGLFP
jgi:hypothetical protein